MTSTRNAVLGGISMFIAGGLFSAIISDNYFQKYSSRQDAINQGRTEATSNLVSAVKSMSKVARERIDYRFQEAVKRAQTGRIAVGQEIAYGYKISDSYIEVLERAIKAHAENIAKGNLNIKETDEYQYLAEKP